jgi:SAM-dependent methyltransferase
MNNSDLQNKIFHLSKSYSDNGKSTLEVLEFAKNYNKWIATKILPFLSEPVLEIGAGTGNITEFVLQVKHVFITDYDKKLLTFLKKKFNKKKNLSIYSLDIENAILKTHRNYFSSIYAVNVLEHIKNDEKALCNIRSMLKPGGRIVLLVPAKKAAYTRLDKELGHFRRYEKKELLEKLQRSGYAVEKIEFFNIVGLISWFARDKIDADHTKLKFYQIALFEGIIPVLRTVESLIKVPIGISLIVVGRKI